MPPVPQNTPTAPPSGLDPDAVNLARSIRQVESGGNFSARGKTGEFGAYQFMPATWNATASKFGVSVPLDQATPAQQNEVAYKQIKEWKDAGHNVGQIASMWNAGPGRPNAYLEGNAGTNSSGAKYDTALYARHVAENYQAIKGGADVQNQQPQLPDQPAAPSFLGNLTADLQRRDQNFKDSQARQDAGQQSGFSTALQGVGQVAGYVGDAFGEALGAADRLLTGGTVGKIVGGAVQGIAQSGPGQAAIHEYQGFKQDHPEFAGNLEAVGNIASVFPMGKGLQLGKEALGAGLAKAGESEAVQGLAKGAVNDVKANLAEVLQGTKPNAARYEFATSKGIDPAQILAERKLIPEVIDGKIVTDHVLSALEPEIAAKSTLLDSALSKYKQTVSVDEAKQIVRNEIAQDREFKQQGRVPEMQKKAEGIIDSYAAQEGKDKFTLKEIQGFKKGQYSLSSRYSKAMDFGAADDHAAVASAFRQIIEKKASDVAVRSLNKEIGALEETLKIADKANGSAVVGGRLGRYSGRLLGATIGSQGHIPIISPILGAFIGDAVITGIQKAKIAGPLNRLLMKIAHIAPDNKVVNETLDFIQKVESGEKVMPSDDVAEFLAHITSKANIPLLPEGVSKEFRSIVHNQGTINLPEKSTSTIDAESQARAVSQTPVSEMLNEATQKPTNLLGAPGESAIRLPEKSAAPNIKGEPSSPTTSLKPSTDTVTSTGSAATGKEGVSAQKADTSVPFDGVKSYAGDHRPDASGDAAHEISNLNQLRSQIVQGHHSQTLFTKLEKMQGDPNTEVTIYRASPVKGLNEGDWVTLDKDYAQRMKNDVGGAVHAYKVKASDLRYNTGTDSGNGFNFGYHPSEVSSPSIPKELEPLAAEAKKYKSAEEFVKAQADEGKIAYHGSQAQEIRGVPHTTKGSMGEAFYLTNDPARAESFGKDGKVPFKDTGALFRRPNVHATANTYAFDLSALKIKTFNNDADFFAHVKDPDISAWLRLEGFDGLHIKSTGNYAIFNTGKLKTLGKASDLTDLYNKVNGQAPKTQPAPRK